MATMTTKERPILFIAPMVRAILEDRKTKTRRLMNKLLGFGAITEFDKSNTPGYDWHFRDKKMRWHDLTHEELLKCCPYGQPGDLLWVRETFVIENGGTEYETKIPYEGHPKRLVEIPDGEGGVGNNYDVPHYRATEPDALIMKWDCLNGDCDHQEEGQCERTRWTPGIHMPRWASRIDLRIKSIRVERLQDISEEDAKAEGAPQLDLSHVKYFKKIWDEINGEESWTANPWVWVVEFERVRP